VRKYGSKDKIKVPSRGDKDEQNDIEFIVKLTGVDKNVVGKTHPWQIPSVDYFVTNRQLYEEFDVPKEVFNVLKKPKIRPLSAYGFSISDLDKAMNKAFNIAARRAIVSPLILTPISIDNKTGPERWIPNYETQANIKYIVPPLELESKRLTTDTYKLVETFDLRLSDIVQALLEYKSTINKNEYATYMKYVATGITPYE
jgi:hypothetical protein